MISKGSLRRCYFSYNKEKTQNYLSFKHKRKAHPLDNGTWFEIVFEIQTDTFKEIKQKRAYSEQSLIGNLGGYLGIFIGFSLLDLLKCMVSVRIKIYNAIALFFNREKLYELEPESRQLHCSSTKGKQRKCHCCKLMQRKLNKRSQYYQRTIRQRANMS